MAVKLPLRGTIGRAFTLIGPIVSPSRYHHASFPPPKPPILVKLPIVVSATNSYYCVYLPMVLSAVVPASDSVSEPPPLHERNYDEHSTLMHRNLTVKSSPGGRAGLRLTGWRITRDRLPSAMVRSVTSTCVHAQARQADVPYISQTRKKKNSCFVHTLFIAKNEVRGVPRKNDSGRNACSNVVISTRQPPRTKIKLVYNAEFCFVVS